VRECTALFSLPANFRQFAVLCSVVSYAALALHDGGAEVTSDQVRQLDAFPPHPPLLSLRGAGSPLSGVEQIIALLKATGHEVEPYWPVLFAGMLSSRGVSTSRRLIRAAQSSRPLTHFCRPTM
jgi:hypothetical protein